MAGGENRRCPNRTVSGCVVTNGHKCNNDYGEAKYDTFYLSHYFSKVTVIY